MISMILEKEGENRIIENSTNDAFWENWDTNIIDKGDIRVVKVSNVYLEGLGTNVSYQSFWFIQKLSIGFGFGFSDKAVKSQNLR